jgi:thiamine biosynthesis lipoprotein
VNILNQQIQHALGSECSITFSHSEEENVSALFQECWKLIVSFENQFSRFKPESELSKFNARAGEKTQISTEFKRLLQTCVKYNKLTAGLFDPFVLPALQRAGYIGSWPNPSSYNTSQNYEGRHHPSPIDDLEIGDNWGRISDTSALDLGGIGKGYLLRELVLFLRRESVNGYWISLGGDIVCSGFDNDDNPWSIGIARTVSQVLPLPTVENVNGDTLAVATSGIIKRNGIRNDKQWHHIIDPRTGEPAVTDILTATAINSDPITADILAKCAVIVGTANIFKLQHPDSEVTFELQLKNNSAVVTSTGGMKIKS